jgi:ATP-dependent exoDNAse (exonuclease V) alpha subunit
VRERAARSETRVAIYHLSVKLVTRGAGRSATAAVAYRAATRVPDERTGLVFDYSRKRGVEHTEIVLPARVAETAEWARDRARLWNAAEAAENRKDARVAREYEVALPHELNAQQRRELVRGFARELAERHGCAIDVAIHAPHREGDARNHHAHILATTRAVTEAGLGAKTDIELKDADRTRRGLCAGKHEITAIRERWAALVNDHLAAQGRSERIDHRSLAEQGTPREPTFHKGPAVTALERRAERAFVSERAREEVTERLRAAVELGRLERESQHLARSIIDTTTQLQAALATRAVERVRSLEDIRRDAQAAWLASREPAATSPPQPGADHRPMDLSGDLAAARRDAREQWLALRERERESAGQAPPAGQEAKRDAPRLIVPDDDRAR